MTNLNTVRKDVAALPPDAQKIIFDLVAFLKKCSSSDQVRSEIMPEKSLYDRDFTAWVKLTTQQLKDKNFEQLDLENLIDEVESLIFEQKKWIRESLIKILTYVMKRMHLDIPDRFHDWELYILRGQQQLQSDVRDNASILEYWDELFDDAWEIVLIRLEYDFKTDEEFDRHPYPKTWQLSKDFEFLVTDDFYLNLKK